MAEAGTEIGKASKLKTLGVRAVSGLALIGICGFPVYFGGWVFMVLVLVFTLRMMWEWVRMSDKQAGWPSYCVHLLGVVLALCAALYQNWQLGFLVVCICAGLAVLIRLKQGGLIWAILGPFYIIIPSLAILWLRGSGIGPAAPGFLMLMFVLAVVVAADSFAYLGGSLLKGPKLAPKISPNKTWSGFIVGGVMAAVIGAISAFFIGFSPLTGLLLALPIVLFAVWGDFLESYIKRILEVKDAGGVLPGHGGLLDRVDSLMLAVLLSTGFLLVWPGLSAGFLPI